MGHHGAPRLRSGASGEVSEPILDPTALARLRRIGGDKLLRAMVASFVENGTGRIDAARNAARDGDARALSDAAHALKSSAGNLGAETLRLTAQKVEREAVEPGAALEALASELADAFAHAREAALAAPDATDPG